MDTVRGNTQPNRVSWMLWTLAPMIAFAAEVTQSVGLQSLLTFAIGFGPLLVVCASFLDPKAYARVTPFDVLCGALSLIALVAWAVTGTGNVAIFLSILADFFGAVPTLRKSYRDPESEHAVAFLAGRHRVDHHAADDQGRGLGFRQLGLPRLRHRGQRGDRAAHPAAPPSALDDGAFALRSHAAPPATVE